MTRLLAGIDVGGTKTEALLADVDGHIRGRATVPTDSSGGPGVVQSTCLALDQALHAANASRKDVAAVGLGVPGQVDVEQGRVRLAVNLNLRDYPLAQVLSQKLGGRPVVVENDVRIAAVGVYHYLQQHDPVDSVAYLSIGTGVAAGLVYNGKLYRGAGGMAGEIGHVIVEPQGQRCNCGLYGCLETVVAGPAIARQAAPFLSDNGQQPVTAEVYQAAQTGHPQAQALIRRVSAFIARAIHLLAMLYDVDRIVLGGGVTRTGDAFWRPVAAELEKMRAQSSLAQTMLSEERVRLLPVDYNPGVWGAFTLAKQAAEI